MTAADRAFKCRGQLVTGDSSRKVRRTPALYTESSEERQELWQGKGRLQAIPGQFQRADSGIFRQPASVEQNPCFADHAVGTGGDSDLSKAGVKSGYPRLGIGSRWGSPLVAAAVDNLGQLSPAVGGRTGLLQGVER
jgi:hypothetical protein